MTAATGDAMSQVLWKGATEAFCHEFGAANLAGFPLHRRLSVHGPHICSRDRCMAPMTNWREQQSLPRHSIPAITCAKLVVTDDDLARQYF